MAKKNFKSATEDIFGAYKQPVDTATPNKEAPIKEYELFLLAIDKAHLARLATEAKKNEQEIKDVLDTILSRHYDNIVNA